MNVENRIKEHNSGQSNFTSSGTPWKLLWCTVKQDESAALILETKIKNLSVRKKLDFMSKNSEDIVNRELYYKLH